MVRTRAKSNTLKGTTTKDKIVNNPSIPAIKRQKTNSSNAILEESGKIIIFSIANYFLTFNTIILLK